MPVTVPIYTGPPARFPRPAHAAVEPPRQRIAEPDPGVVGAPARYFVGEGVGCIHVHLRQPGEERGQSAVNLEAAAFGEEDGSAQTAFGKVAHEGKIRIAHAVKSVCADGAGDDVRFEHGNVQPP